jgi:hypothetical protein
VDHHDVVAGIRVAEALDAGVVLIAPEERHRLVRGGLTPLGRHQEVAGGGGTLLGGVGPVLEPHLFAEELVTPAHHITGGEHARWAGGQPGVGHDAIAHLEAAAGQPVGHRRHADAHHHDVGVHHGAVTEADPLHPLLALDGGDADTQAYVDAPVAVEVGEHRPDLGPEGPFEGRRQRLDHGDGKTFTARRGRHLGPDEAGTDDDDAARPGVERRPQGQRIVERAEHEEPVERRLTGQHARRGTGGDDQAVVRHGAAVAQGDLAGGRVEGGGPLPEPEVEAEGAVLRRPPQLGALDVELAGEELLRQRRAVVGQVLLGADQGEGAAVALGPQGLRRPEPGQRRTHHHDARQHGVTLGRTTAGGRWSIQPGPISVRQRRRPPRPRSWRP